MMRILVPRPAGAPPAGEIPSKKDCTFVHVPLIKTTPPADDYQSLDAALKQLADFDWVVFTSQHGASAFVDRYRYLGVKTSMPSLVAVGEKTAAPLEKGGWKLRYVAQGQGERYLIDYFAGIASLAGQKVLFPKSQIGLSELENYLKLKKCAVHRVEAYQTLPDFSQQERLNLEFSKGIDAVFLYSPSQVEALEVMLKNSRQILSRLPIYVQGATTAARAKQKDWTVAGFIADFTVAIRR